MWQLNGLTVSNGNRNGKEISIENHSAPIAIVMIENKYIEIVTWNKTKQRKMMDGYVIFLLFLL